MAVVPIKGHFQDWRALLAHIMEDDEVEHFAIVTTCKGGGMKTAQFEMTRAEMAYAALLLQRNALLEE